MKESVPSENSSSKEASSSSNVTNFDSPSPFDDSYENSEKINFLIFDERNQNEADQTLAHKFWQQFELEPQIESRLVEQDSVTHSRHNSSKRRIELPRLRSQPIETKTSEETIRRATVDGSSTRMSVSKMVVQLKNNKHLKSTKKPQPPKSLSPDDLTSDLKQIEEFESKVLSI